MKSKIVQEAVNAHKKACEKWREGEPVKAWVEDGALCIKYESGNWWHYVRKNGRIEWY